MEGFSIDDVRDTIGTDIAGFLERIEKAAGTIADPSSVRLGDKPLSIIGDAGHAIYGTSSLVGAESIASTARAIEELAEHGKQELLLAAKHLERLKDIALAARAGAGEMRVMLGLELDHRPEEALRLARAWHERTLPLLAIHTEVPEHGATNGAVEPDTAKTDDLLMTELRDVFAQEAKEIITVVRAELTKLRAQPADLAAMRTLERSFHTLKGASATVGLHNASDAASNIQNRLLEVVEEGVPANAELIDQLSADSARLLAAAGLPAEWLAAPQETENKDRHQVPPVDPELWNVFEEECGGLLETLEHAILALEDHPQPAEELSRLLPTYHTLKGVVNTIGLAPTGELVHRVEDLLEKLVHASALPPAHKIVTVLLNVQKQVRRNLGQAKQGFVEVPLASFTSHLASLMPNTNPPAPVEPMAVETEQEDDVASRRSVKVSADRLDRLMDLAGELVVSRSRLITRVQNLRSLQLDLGQESRNIIEHVERFSEEHEFALLSAGNAARLVETEASVGTETFSELELDRYGDVQVLSRTLAELNGSFGDIWKKLAAGLEALTSDSDAFGAIVGGIRSEVTRARTVPLEVLFSQLKVPVRDVAMREAKDVRVTTRGSDVHLDKTIADELLQPMLHLVRNAVVHGIESRETRESHGKPATGMIELTAREELDQIVLEVRDDGGGLDLSALHKKGVELGLIREDTPLFDPAVRELVFAAGLSTEEDVSAVAGRGLGCDFVKRAVERLNGSVRVETQAGHGTTFILTLPITLAITKALLIKHAGRSYAVPLYFAERILDPSENELVDAAGMRRVRIDDVYLPITRMSKIFGVESDAARAGALIVLRMGSQRMVVEADGVVGQEEVVVKNLGVVLNDHPLFSGVTIRGTGELVLILDVPALIEAREARERVFERGPVRLAPRTISPVAKPQLQPAAKKPRVLFVDDSLSVRKAAERMFLALNAEITLAVDGVDALAKIAEATFDVVFTDLEMPRMHGFDLIGELRSRATSRDLPIVVVTSRAATKHRDQAWALGASEYLTKPFTASALEATLEKWGRAKKTEVV